MFYFPAHLTLFIMGCRLTQLVTCCKGDAALSAARTMSCFTRYVRKVVDVVIANPSQAKENIRKAAETRNPTERQKYLAESLR